MDEKRFDTLTRRLGQATGRRQVLRHLGGGLLGVLGGAVVRGRAAEAAPKRRGPGEQCGPGRGNQCAEGLSCLNTNPGGVGTCGGGCGQPLDCDDGNPCTTDSCANGTCSHAPVAAGANGCVLSGGGNGVCDGAGNCVQCLTPAQCPPATTPCQEAVCTAGACGFQNVQGNSGASCSTGRAGICAAGTLQCDNGQLTCIQTNQPRAESCNGLDNNCDGTIDQARCGPGRWCLDVPSGIRCCVPSGLVRDNGDCSTCCSSACQGGFPTLCA